MEKYLINPHSQPTLELPPFSRDALIFHQSLPDYSQTLLHSAKLLAESIGCNNIYIKDESTRLSLPAFKILGASYATIKVLEQILGIHYTTIDDFKRKLSKIPDLKLITATDGNHGRAVSHMANILDIDCQIYMPKHTKIARIEAIESEGAEVIVVDGNYDYAVELAGSQKGVIIQDTGYAGYEKIPKYIVEGYSTMFWEIDQQLQERNLPQPDVIIAPIGVGSFICSVIQFYKSKLSPNPPIILGVEPELAPCAYKAIKEDRIVELKGPYESVMAGLSCGKISSISFSILKEGVDAFLLVSDMEALSAMKILANEKITSGESGSASFAGLSLLFSDEGEKLREYLKITESDSVLVFSTEGVTDPEMYNAVMSSNNLEDLLLS